MEHFANNRVVLTGGPGTGKTTVLAELRRRGISCVDEVTRKVIQERIAAGLPPRPDPASFALEIFQRDVAAYDSVARIVDPVFFDRGLVDSLVMMFECGAVEESEVQDWLARKPFAKTVFLFPPWEEIYRAMVGQLGAGACLEPATLYINVIETRGESRNNH